MTAKDIRELCVRNVEAIRVVWSESPSDAIAMLQYSALQEIAAQLAEFNEQGNEFREIVRMWAREKGFMR
jgi:hypothetical protein